jgi:hypothetical protein
MDGDEVLTDPVTGEEIPLEPRGWKESPAAEPQPLQELVTMLQRAREDIGGLVARVDQLETTIRRVDRQTIMMAGSLAVILWTVKSILGKLQGLEGGVDAGV